jgi:hypothetical protein
MNDDDLIDYQKSELEEFAKEESQNAKNAKVCFRLVMLLLVIVVVSGALAKLCQN